MATMGPAKENALGESNLFSPLPDSQDYVYGVAFFDLCNKASAPKQPKKPHISRSPK